MFCDFLVAIILFGFYAMWVISRDRTQIEEIISDKDLRCAGYCPAPTSKTQKINQKTKQENRMNLDEFFDSAVESATRNENVILAKYEEMMDEYDVIKGAIGELGVADLTIKMEHEQILIKYKQSTRTISMYRTHDEVLRDVVTFLVGNKLLPLNKNNQKKEDLYKKELTYKDHLNAAADHLLRAAELIPDEPKV